MSANAIMEGLKRGSEAEHEFVKQLREVMCTILNRMVVECYGRGDALDELKERMRDGGHTHETTEGLLAEIQALKDEKAVLQGDIRAWQLKAAAAHRSPQQSGTPAGLSNRRKKVLVRIVNTAISHSNDAHTCIDSRANEILKEATADETTTFNLTNTEQKSVELKHSLNKLVDMVDESGNTIAAQDLKNAMRHWGDIHRCLVAERESASKRWGRQNGRTWDIFKEDRELIRGSIIDLKDIAVELGLDMNRISEDASL